MEISIRIKQLNGEYLEITKDLTISDTKTNNPLTQIEQEWNKLKTEIFPIITTNLLEAHQMDFKGEKNQEKEWL